MDSGAIFDCQKELSAYLKSDVKVLTESMETFASKMLELTGIDPTVECMTIASTAFKVLQTRQSFWNRTRLPWNPLADGATINKTRVWRPCSGWNLKMPRLAAVFR